MRSASSLVLPRLLAVAALSSSLSLAACGGPPAPPPKTAPTVATCPPAATPAGAAHAEPSLEAIKEQVVQRINAGDAPALYAMFSTSMKGTFPPPVIAQLVEGVRTSKGAIKETQRTHDDGDPRSATYAAKAERGDWRLELHIDDAGQVIGLALQEPPPADPPVKDSTLALAMPVRGKWLVAWAGDNPEHNAHHTNKEQRRAADLVIAIDGKNFKGDGKKNEDFYAYGKEVLAMADGTVVTVVDGVPENVPGSVDLFFAPGNMIVLEHAGPTYSVIAHLMPGKMRVKPGAKVKQGAVLGLVGNSGNTVEPHLHVHMQDAPALERAWGVNPVFTAVAVTRGGQASKMDKYSFLRGDVLDVATK